MPNSPSIVNFQEAAGMWSGLKEWLLKFREHLRREAEAPLVAEERRGATGAESASQVFDHHMQTVRRDTARGLLTEVNEALARIAAGTYGICEETGRRIPRERLLSIPWTRHTLEAQEAQEALEHSGGAAAGVDDAGGGRAAEGHRSACGHGHGHSGCGPEPCLNCRKQQRA